MFIVVMMQEQGSKMSINTKDTEAQDNLQFSITIIASLLFKPRTF
jgi:hypothetical protein